MAGEPTSEPCRDRAARLRGRPWGCKLRGGRLGCSMRVGDDTLGRGPGLLSTSSFKGKLSGVASASESTKAELSKLVGAAPPWTGAGSGTVGVTGPVAGALLVRWWAVPLGVSVAHRASLLSAL